jgi:hypothetical protein
LIVGVEPVADEVPGLGESRVQSRVVVSAAKPPVPPVGAADLWQGVQGVLFRAVQPSLVA